MLVVNSQSLVAYAVLLFTALTPSPAAAQVCQPRPGASGKECFVSPAGNDTNPGTILRPFRTIARGIEIVQAGDVLSLRAGVYVESVKIAGKHGTLSRRIVIRSYPGEQASIDGGLPQFRTLDNEDWEPVTGNPSDTVAPHPDEFVSKTSVTGFVRGVFVDRKPYTRLITYSTLEDLRATNETFDTINTANDPHPDRRSWTATMMGTVARL